jgi:hypothetical protein
MAWSHLGWEEPIEGTLLIGRIPHVGPEAWLHKFYSPIPQERLRTAFEGLRCPVPSEYLDILGEVNGWSFFSGLFALYGVRSSYARSGPTIWQPFEVRDANGQERVKGAHPEVFFVGSYPREGYRIGYKTTTGEVFRCARNDPAPLQEWASFSEMLKSEMDRYSRQFDSDGHRID